MNSCLEIMEAIELENIIARVTGRSTTGICFMALWAPPHTFMWSLRTGCQCTFVGHTPSVSEPLRGDSVGTTLALGSMSALWELAIFHSQTSNKYL